MSQEVSGSFLLPGGEGAGGAGWLSGGAEGGALEAKGEVWERKDTRGKVKRRFRGGRGSKGQKMKIS